MNLPITIPFAVAIHGIPLGPLADSTKENEFRHKVSRRNGWMYAPSHQNLRKYRFAKETP